MTPLEDVRQQIDSTAAVIGAARQIVADGRSVDLAGLETRVQRLCETIGRLPRADGAMFEPRILALLDEIDRLTSDIKAQHALLTQELSTLAARRNALAAYGRRGGGNT